MWFYQKLELLAEISELLKGWNANKKPQTTLFLKKKYVNKIEKLLTSLAHWKIFQLPCLMFKNWNGKYWFYFENQSHFKFSSILMYRCWKKNKNLKTTCNSVSTPSYIRCQTSWSHRKSEKRHPSFNRHSYIQSLKNRIQHF